MKCTEIQERFDKYLEEEKHLQTLLKQCRAEQEKRSSMNFQRSAGGISRKSQYISNKDALIRNQKLLKELEVSRARLRTLISFTPTDQELRERITLYRRYLMQVKQNTPIKLDK